MKNSKDFQNDDELKKRHLKENKSKRHSQHQNMRYAIEDGEWDELEELETFEKMGKR